jgi:hypothetical protein
LLNFSGHSYLKDSIGFTFEARRFAVNLSLALGVGLDGTRGIRDADHAPIRLDHERELSLVQNGGQMNVYVRDLAR